MYMYMVEFTPIKLSFATSLLAHDPLSSLAYSMITHIPLVASNLPALTSLFLAGIKRF